MKFFFSGDDVSAFLIHVYTHEDKHLFLATKEIDIIVSKLKCVHQWLF